jgi:tetratricopeptide (TPR) repeat protein
MKSETSTCYMLPEMVDVGVAEMAKEKDLRGSVAEARRAADSRNGVSVSAWPLQPGSLAEAVYWFRQLADQGAHTCPEDISVALSNLGYWWSTDRRWAEAETAFRECTQLCQQRGDRSATQQAFFDLGCFYESQARWTDAEPAFAEALELARETGDRRALASALGRLGIVNAALGQAEKATDHFKQGLSIAQEIGDARLAKQMSEAMARGVKT